MNERYTSLEKLCQQRHSTREFQDRPVPAELIEKIKKIAATSPYASGRKNWRLEVVDDPTIIQRMAIMTSAASNVIAGNLREDFSPLFQTYAQNFSAFANAPLLLIPVFKAFATLSYMLVEEDPEILQWERDNYQKSIACVAMLTLLAAESLGLGACLMTGPLLAEEQLKDVVGLRANQHIGAIIPVGYPATDTRR